MRLGLPSAVRLVPALVLGVLAVLLVPVPAGAAEPTALAVTASPAPAGSDSTVVATLTSGGAPLPGAAVTVERRVGGAWTPVGTTATDGAGRVAVPVRMAREPADNVVRASYAGDATYAPSTSPEVQVALVRRESRVRVTGPGSVVDETSVDLTVRWTTRSGEPVSGRVAVERRDPGEGWRTVARLTTDNQGQARLTVAPRVDTRWRVRAEQLAWVEGGRSPVHRLDNLPPAPPVVLPRRAPEPRITLPPQRRAVGEGPNAVVTRIPDAVWRSMTGRSWHAGCPVGRAGLRLLRINYWDYDGYRRRGEVVAATGAVSQMAGALAAMYAARLPIRAMWRVDRFGWSPRLRGADDYASMAAGNTSAFNCRDVVGRPGVRSPHSYGRSLDVNTWENPFRSAQGIVPNAWWQSRSHPRVAWRSRSHPVVRIMARHGLRWTYAHGDTQHFDATASGRVLYPRGCSWASRCH